MIQLQSGDLITQQYKPCVSEEVSVHIQNVNIADLFGADVGLIL